MLTHDSEQWLYMYHGAVPQSIAIVTAYTSLGIDGLHHALVSTEATAIFVDSASISRLNAVLELGSRLAVNL